MKKIIYLFVLLLALANGAHSASGTPEVPVVAAFERTFTGANHITWLQRINIYQVNFAWEGSWVSAYYNSRSELICVTHQILSSELPLPLQRELKKRYSQFWISELFTLSTDGEEYYYITLQSADKTLILESTDGAYWCCFGVYRK